MIKIKYNKEDLLQKKFYDPPSSSCQFDFGLRISDFSNFPSNKYDFIKKITNGSASTIHLGQDKTTDKYVIIKKISKKEEWRRELYLLKHINQIKSSPNILSYVDFFESPRYLYLVSLYYSGFDLFEHIDINMPYTDNMAYKLLLEMAKCIKICHDLNIVHLDVKCENFIVKNKQLFNNSNDIDDGNVVLIDFGHAEIYINEKIEKLKKGHSYGTIFYLCPEGYQKIYSSKSDIWSLGICLALLLTGDYPFDGDDKEYMYNVSQNNIKFVKKVSSRSNVILSLCLKTNPSERPDIDQLISMLNHGINK
jgi:serine/threonine protein kinase